jgi:8-oxo-dGTP diphosphatase
MLVEVGGDRGAGMPMPLRDDLETGLEVEPQALSGVYKNMRRGIVALVFRCRIIGGEPRPTREA